MCAYIYIYIYTHLYNFNMISSCPIDKVANNLSFICKMFRTAALLIELGFI